MNPAGQRDERSGQTAVAEVLGLPPESPLKISLSTAGPTKEITVVRVDGTVDTMTASELERVISSLLARDKYRLVLDLAGTDYISSAGWGIFISRLREIREHGGDIKLARMTPDVREIYELLEFDGLLPCFDCLDSAAAGFFGERPLVRAPAAPPIAAFTPATPEKPPDGDKLPPGSAITTIDDAVRVLVAEDPFYTISELCDLIRERHPDDLPVGWMRVWSCLRRNRLLRRRSRFRFFREARRQTARGATAPGG